MSKCNGNIIGEINFPITINGKINSNKELNGELNTGILNVSKKNIFQFDSKYNFPTIGDTNSLYISTDENAAYRWNEDDLHYYCVGRDYKEIQLIFGGNANG